VRLFQHEGGYRYNSDSLFFYDFLHSGTSAHFRGKALDVGFGCGILALLFKRDFAKSEVSGVEIQPQNVALAQKNAAENGLAVAFGLGDFSAFDVEAFWENFTNSNTKTTNSTKLHLPDESKKFDLIFANPPFYVECGTRSENAHLDFSRNECHLKLRDFVASTKRALAQKGRFCFCYDARKVGEILPLLSEFKFTLTRLRFVHSKSDRASKLAFFDARLQSKSKCEVLPPLVVFDGESYASEARAAFLRAELDSVDI